MLRIACVALALALLPWHASMAAGPIVWPPGLPIYDHIVIVVEENKDYDQIIGQKAAPYINSLALKGTSLSQMFGEEHNSQGNYFWLFSGSNQGVHYGDVVPTKSNNANYPFKASSLGEQLILKGRTFKGYAESLPAAGSLATVAPPGCGHQCVYARKHVPWASFAALQNAKSPVSLPFSDFPVVAVAACATTDSPARYDQLPTVAIVVPNLNNDMHNGDPAASIPAGDEWLRQNLDCYYRWAASHNSLLIVTFDENDDKSGRPGPTDPSVTAKDQVSRDMQNSVATIFAGAHVRQGYVSARPANHVSILRTIEAMYGLPRSGMQDENAAHAGITDDAIITDIFERS